MLFWGCATSWGYEKILKTWVGHDVNELIRDWGPPADVTKLPDGSMMYTWWFDGGALEKSIGKKAKAVNRYCKTTFAVNNQSVIQTWRWEGNACRR